MQWNETGKFRQTKKRRQHWGARGVDGSAHGVEVCFLCLGRLEGTHAERSVCATPACEKLPFGYGNSKSKAGLISLFIQSTKRSEAKSRDSWLTVVLACQDLTTRLLPRGGQFHYYPWREDGNIKFLRSRSRICHDWSHYPPDALESEVYSLVAVTVTCTPGIRAIEMKGSFRRRNRQVPGAISFSLKPTETKGAHATRMVCTPVRESREIQKRRRVQTFQPSREQEEPKLSSEKHIPAPESRRPPTEVRPKALTQRAGTSW